MAGSKWDIPEIIGKRGRLLASGMEFTVRVLAAKTVFGERRALIEPEAGEGRAWVAMGRVRVEREGGEEAGA